MTQKVMDKKIEKKVANGTDKSVKPVENRNEWRDATLTKVFKFDKPP